ncbi:MAG TPA: hypothetical protein VK923_14630 [Euzebyales bacterium]|nr:hypothetical protein [Euzebyales bacterium]
MHAKTGTLHDVRALAATVPSRGGHDHHIAILVNEVPTYDDAVAARRLADVLPLAVVAADDGCLGPVRAPDGTDRRPPEHHICGEPGPTRSRATVVTRAVGEGLDRPGERESRR